MQIGEVMTRDPVSAPGHATLAAVAGLMRDRNVGSVVIVDDGRPVALITDRDVALVLGADGANRSDEVGPMPTGRS